LGSIQTSKRRTAPLAALSCLGALCLSGPAQAAQTATPADINDLSLEELAALEVTSVSKHPQRLSEAPAAIYVITREDIRRSGATSLPEALRLAPNLEVARQNAASYSIAARGFNSPQAGNKLQVLIDGRSVYTPMASTVFWETLNVMLPDVERIEVISGPGGTVWGANAVNGVINIVTRKAGDTQGGYAEGGVGGQDRVLDLRYGGTLGENAAFRLYATGFSRGSTLEGDHDLVHGNGFRGVQGGFRIDGEARDDTYTLQGDAYRNVVDLLAYRLNGANLLGRWTHPMGAASTLTLQAYVDRADRRYLVATDRLDSLGLEAQANTTLGERQRVTWGADFRAWRSEFDSFVIFGFARPKANLSVGSVFARDEIALPHDLELTLGLKLEQNSYSGFDYLPDVRLAWEPNDQTLVWSSVSRTVRTPSRIDRELSGAGIIAESPNFASEVLVAYQIGYRLQPTPRTSLSISTFYNAYDDLRTTELTNGGLPVMLRNGLQGHTSGLEAWGKYSVNPSWRLSAGVSTLRKKLRVEHGHFDLSHGQTGGQDPSYQASLRSEMNLSPRVEFDVGLRAVGRVSPTNVPAYVEADARIGWRITDQVALSLNGYNLLHSDHLEVINPATATVMAIPRSAYVSLRWEY